MLFIKRVYLEDSEAGLKDLPSFNFDRGLNFIVGEKSETNVNVSERKKMNGVGKSLLVEIIDYCFLSDYEKNRVSRIPDITLDPKLYFCLELQVEKNDKISTVIIKRNRERNKKTIFIVDGKEKTFDDLNSAKEYLSYLTFNEEKDVAQPSFRQMLSLVLRNEDALYDDILYPYPNSSNYDFEDLLKPHLYLFKVNLELINAIKTVSQNFKSADKAVRELNKDFKEVGIQEKEIESYINDLEDKVGKLAAAVNALKPGEAMQQKKQELNALRIELDELVTQKVSREYSVEKIKKLPDYEEINTKQLRRVYNHFKSGLGDLVEKSFEQVLGFKEQIDDFQTSLMNEKLEELNKEIQLLDVQIERVDTAISDIYTELNIKEEVASLTDAIRQERVKSSELDMLTTKYSMLKEKREKKRQLKKKKEKLIDDLGVMLFEVNTAITKFEDDLKEMHNYIAGNKRCQFDINISESLASFVEFSYRVRLDGSSGVNRIKTLIYDVLLMTNNFTSKRHLGFLIHDNIFASSGLDDRVKTLNYLHKLSKVKKFQYILTINRDEFETAVSELDFDYTVMKKVELTRDKLLLGKEYSEL